ncbi:MAG: hypothetical protein ACKOOL_01585 [Novosphingobium sp.]
MSDETITTTRSADGSVEHTTVRGGSSGGWVIGLIAIVLLGFAVYYFAIASNSSSRKDNAVAAAAQDVGDAAKNVGNAAQDAASNLKKQ